MKSVLVTLANNDYTPQAKQLFYSAKAKGQWGYDFCLLTDGLSQENTSWFIKNDIQLVNSKWPSIVLLKFELFNAYFQKWDTVLFLDCDIMVEGPIESLALPNGFSAALDPTPFHDQIIINQVTLGLLKELGSSPRAKAFNAGVLSLETNKISPTRYKELIEQYIKIKEYLLYPEQAILNLVFFPEWKRLRACYNVYMPVGQKICFL